MTAICFCHRRPITRGFVCSVCLTVLCEFRALCPTCGSRFTLDTDALPVAHPTEDALRRAQRAREEQQRQRDEARRRREEQRAREEEEARQRELDRRQGNVGVVSQGDYDDYTMFG